ncbi:MAG: hypothetical protein WKF97_17600 [Chitinophagaceae bacterium]
MKSLKGSISVVFILTFLLLLQSCYSVILVNKKGVPTSDPLNNDIGFYNGKQVIEIDTTITLQLTKNYLLFQEGCPEGGFYSVEYRASLGGVLLSAITFGKKRKVKVKYTCLKEKN